MLTVFGRAFLYSFLYQLGFFIVTAIFRFDKLTDFAGGTNFCWLALYCLLRCSDKHQRLRVVTAFIVTWASRLSLFLLYRIFLWNEDRRLREFRSSLVKLASFWFFQTVWVWVVSLPGLALSSAVVRSFPQKPFGYVDYLGWIIWTSGFLIESISDLQKLRHQRRPAGKSSVPWCVHGLWRFSRHPNYFGEICVWWGVFLSSCSGISSSLLLLLAGIASPLFTMFLLLFISGMPLLERSMNRKYLHIMPSKTGRFSETEARRLAEAFRTYKNETSPLIPLPPSLYSNLPRMIKRIFFFEWRLYNMQKSASAQELGSSGNETES